MIFVTIAKLTLGQFSLILAHFSPDRQSNYFTDIG